MAILWDLGKGQATSRSTGTFCRRGLGVFDDPVAITVVDDESDPIEQRSVVLGAGAAGRIPVVVYSWRGDKIRLISARRAEPHERAEYEKQ